MILAAMQPGEICSILMVCDDFKNMIEGNCRHRKIFRLTYLKIFIAEEISDCSLCEAVYFNFNYLHKTQGKILPEHVCNPLTKKYVKPVRLLYSIFYVFFIY